MISWIYECQVYSGDESSPRVDTRILNFPSKIHSAGFDLNALTPPMINKALASARLSALGVREKFKCSTCINAACNICSSVVVTHKDTFSPVLSIIEKFHLSCNNKCCVSLARQKRNEDSKKLGLNGCGFKMTFRCARSTISK